MVQHNLKLALLATMLTITTSQRPTVYEYFGSGSNIIGLVAENREFTLNGRYIRIISGAIHYFRSKIEINDQEIEGVEIMALEFKNAWVKGLQNWRYVTDGPLLKAPCLIQSTFTITGDPTDTFLDMSNWHKGIVFVNGFNIGRYFKVGPQQTLYIPAPLLTTGENTITIFEQLETSNQIVFTDVPNLGRHKPV